MSTAEILIVEDEGIVAQNIRRSLHRWGYSVPAVVPSGEEALTKVEQVHPDLVLMDIKLQGRMDGIDACQQLRRRFDIPVVYLTSYADEETLARAKLTEPFGYLLKPFEEKELCVTVEMALYKHRMESRLRESEQWLTTILHSIGEGVIVTDAAAEVRFINLAAEAMTGWARGDALGREVFVVLPIVHEANRAPIENPGARALRTGAAVAMPYDCLLLARDGREVPIEGSVAPLYDPHGTFTGMVVIFRDSSERRTMEHVLRRLEEQRLHAQKHAALTRLAGGVARDFNNMLTAILGYSDLLRNTLPAGEPGRGFIDEIILAGERAATVVQRLQTFSGGQVLAPIYLDLNCVLHRMEKMMQRLAGPSVRFNLVRDPHLSQVRVDPVQMEQAILSLVSNARDAMPHGGTLRLETANVTLQASDPVVGGEAEPGAYVMLAVADTGCGMSPDTMAHLFEPYFTTKSFELGTGLGLAPVYGFVKQSGGYVAVQSEPGCGTTFRLYLPVAHGPELETEADDAALLAGGETILLAEGDDTVRQVTAQLLRVRGYSVLEARDEMEAIQIGEAHEGPIQALILDTSLCRPTGWQLVRTLLSMRPGLRVLYLSSGYEWPAAEATPACPADCLAKPFAADTLLAKVRELLTARSV